MAKREKKSSRDLGLEVAATCGRHFLKLEHLHYGYWSNGLEVDVTNLHKAQEQYTNLLISHIPRQARTILDVGCGPGRTAKRLLDLGHQVSCVSPNPFLTHLVRELLGDTCHIFECKYQDMETENRYDLIMFSESFQYVPMEKSLQTTLRFLNDGGHLLICDVFQTDAEGISTIRGGHKLAKFRDLLARYPFEVVEDLDITEATAPSLDILDDMLKNVARPVLDSTLRFLDGRYPLITRLLRWKYRKQIDKTCGKYFKDGRTSEDFKKFKTYRLFLLKKTDSPEL